MRKRFYISPTTPSIYQVELILQEWLDNNRYEMLNLTKLTSELNEILSKSLPWSRPEVDMQMVDEDGFTIDVKFFDTSRKKYETILTTISW